MARILAVDWDGVEARFVLGSILKDRLIVSNAGSAPIENAASEAAAAADDEDEDPDGSVGASADAAADDEEDEDDGVVETVEKAYIPRMPVADDEEEEEDEHLADPTVVSTVKKGRGESFKTSPIARTLKQLFRERRVGSAVLCYSAERGDVDVMYMTIPNASDMEIPELIYNQALRDSLTFNENQPLDFMTLGLPETPKKTGFRRVAAVSIARDKLRRIRETLAGAYHAPAKIELREPSLAEFLRADFCGLRYDEPVLLIQELCDEANLTLCYQKSVLYFRSFKILAESSAQERAARIHEEIVRTLAVGLDDLPEDAVVSRAVIFTDAIPQPDNPDDDEEEERVEPESVASFLENLLLEDEILLDRVNPFRLAGIRMRTPEPANPGRYASTLGMLLAERPQSRPSVDLLHPHEKPKPPNFTLLFLGYFILVGVAALVAWTWNKGELVRLNEELTVLETTRNEVLQEYNLKAPGFNVLRNVNMWQNQQGVIVLDELRDIATRLPSSPAFVATRLAYMASYSGNVPQLRNKPVFIISAKITGIEVYQQFVRNMQLNGAHTVYCAKGPVNNPGGDYKYMFEAFIICQRRPAQSFLAVLPPEIQQISQNRPEYFVEQEEEQRRKLVETQEKNFNDNAALVTKALDVVAAAPGAQPAEGEEAPAEPTIEELVAYGGKLEEARQELQKNFAAASALAQQNGLTQEQAQELSVQFKNADNALVNKWNEISKVVAAKRGEAAAKAAAEAKEAAAKAAAEARDALRAEVEAAAAEPTPEKDEALRVKLLEYRQKLDAAGQQKMVAHNNGQMSAEEFEQAKAEYQSDLAYVMKSWNELAARVQARAAQPAAPAEAQPAPEQPEAPAEAQPAPEQPAAPAEAQPAPEQPAAPAEAPVEAQPAPEQPAAPAEAMRLTSLHSEFV